MNNSTGVSRRYSVAPLQLSLRDVLSLQDDSVAGRFSEVLANVPEQGTLTPESYRLIANRGRLSLQLAEWGIKQIFRLPEDFRELMGSGFVSAYVPFRMLRSGQLESLLGEMQKLSAFPLSSLVLELSPDVLYEDEAEVAEKMYSAVDNFGVRFMLSGFGGEFCPVLRIGAFHFAYVLLDDTAWRSTADAARLAAASGAEVILGVRGGAQYKSEASLYLSARRVIAPDGRYLHG